MDESEGVGASFNSPSGLDGVGVVHPSGARSEKLGVARRDAASEEPRDSLTGESRLVVDCPQ